MKMTSGHRDFGGTAFLIGAGRSGTTLLYKLLCLHASVGYISNYINRAPWYLAGAPIERTVARSLSAKLNSWFKAGGNAYFMKRPLLKRFFPTPVEGERIFASSGLPLIPPAGYRIDARTARALRRKFELLRWATGSQVFLSKRTANNRRIAALDEAIPDARYIHLIRDGREVAHSLSAVEWWSDHVIWWDGRTAAEMERSGMQRLSICARNWVKELEAIQDGFSGISRDRILEVRYERLLEQPVEQLEAILEFLGLPASGAYRDAIASLGLSNRPAAWSRNWSSSELAHVMSEESGLLSELGYV
jgi:omega-hydroxy-beta-dihydromenaquinone-9 sulfotransferase